MSGESEAKIRDLFEKAKQSAPCIVFIDEIDVISPKRETAQREMERRIVAQLLTSMDTLQMQQRDNAQETDGALGDNSVVADIDHMGDDGAEAQASAGPAETVRDAPRLVVY